MAAERAEVKHQEVLETPEVGPEGEQVERTEGVRELEEEAAEAGQLGK